MNQKVILILADGLRPDAILSCGNPYGSRLLTLGSYSLEAKTVYPSITLPCHMSLFHSVPPERHGILTNTYTPFSRPVQGLCERLRIHEKTSAFFYDWEELRDLTRPSSLSYSFYISAEIYDYERADKMLTENALSYIASEKPDFAFVYLQLTDHAGHKYGWMSEEYQYACTQSLEKIRKLVECFNKEYNIIVTADHGGHGRDHGSTMSEDMTIPLICIGERFCPGEIFSRANICDIAPTITTLQGITPSKDWEGKSLL